MAQSRTMSWMQQTKVAHAVNAVTRDVLQKAPQEFMRRQSHHAALVIGAVAVGEGDVTVVSFNDGFVAKGSAMDVATEVFEDALSAVHYRFGEDDPTLAPWDVRQGLVRERFSRQLQKSASK